MPRATKWHYGLGPANSIIKSEAVEGDYYFDQENFIIYFFDGTNFVEVINLTENNKKTEKCIVTFDTNGGKFVSETIGKIVVEAGSTINIASIPLCTMEGYSFEGYYTTPEGPANPLSGRLTDLTPIFEDTNTFSVIFQINQKKYHENTNNISINSGLGIKLTFTSSSLFNHVKEDVKNDFISLGYGSDYSLTMKYGEKYLSGGNNCLEFDSENLTCYSHISFSSDSAGGDFYIQRIAEDNDFDNRYSTVVGGVEMDFVWNFNLNFNFEIIDKSIGYSKEFNVSTFGNVNVELIFEDYR